MFGLVMNVTGLPPVFFPACFLCQFALTNAAGPPPVSPCFASPVSCS